MMKLILPTVTMMAVTVVYLIPTQTSALNAFAITRRCVQLELLILWLEMDVVKMKPTMLNATMMGVTVVALGWSQIIVLNVNVLVITTYHITLT